MLHAVDVQRGLQWTGWVAALTLWGIWGNEIDQRSPGFHPVHLSWQFLLAGLLDAQAQIKAASPMAF